MTLATGGGPGGLLLCFQLLMTIDTLIVVCILNQFDVLGIGCIFEFLGIMTARARTGFDLAAVLVHGVVTFLALDRSMLGVWERNSLLQRLAFFCLHAFRGLDDQIVFWRVSSGQDRCSNQTEQSCTDQADQQ